MTERRNHIVFRSCIYMRLILRLPRCTGISALAANLFPVHPLKKRIMLKLSPSAKRHPQYKRKFFCARPGVNNPAVIRYNKLRKKE